MSKTYKFRCTEGGEQKRAWKGTPFVKQEVELIRGETVEEAIKLGHFVDAEAVLDAAYAQRWIKVGAPMLEAARSGEATTIEQLQQIGNAVVLGGEVDTEARKEAARKRAADAKKGASVVAAAASDPELAAKLRALGIEV